MPKTLRQATTVKPGGVIELEPTDIPAGSAVEIIVMVTEDNGEQSASTSYSNDDKWARFYKNVVGVWKDDDDINQIFAEIDRERHLDRSDETPNFDDDVS
ncbi:MAG: hypothetical protein AAGN15_02250 [Cyanobacteria bacterium J06581_3]